MRTPLKTRKQQHGGWTREITVKFYGKKCLLVISWKKRFSEQKQVLAAFPLEIKFLTAATFEGLWLDPSQID